jgi:hypothetical protein
LVGKGKQRKQESQHILVYIVAILFATTGECKMIVSVWGVKSAKIVLVGDN